MFERHKLIMATQMCMAILRKRGELQHVKFDYLLRAPRVIGSTNPLPDWVPDNVWASVQSLKVARYLAF